MLTFSRSAATEFKKRLMELIGNAAHYVDIKTFHSFSFDLLGRPGNLDDAGSVVLKAATMIENGEVEESKIAKSVLVIDEAQDMGNDESRLLLSLMRRNEDMRVIAVGDDDQNIYQFRGSDSAHLRSLVSDHGATLYEMTTNYRSAGSIVSLANRFATLLPNRMKQTPCKPFRKESGTTRLHLYSNTGFLPLVVEQIAKSGVHGSTCLLTTTNDDAMQAVFLLEEVHGREVGVFVGAVAVVEITTDGNVSAFRSDAAVELQLCAGILVGTVAERLALTVVYHESLFIQ